MPEIPKGYKQTEVGVIPEGWEVRQLSGVVAAITRGASPRPIDSPVWFSDSSSVGWVRISDVTDSGRRLERTVQKLSPQGIRNSRFVSAGSLIMSICATVGRPVITSLDVCIHDGFVWFDNPSVSQEFLFYVLKEQEPKWKLRGQTGSQMNLNTELIKRTLICVPSTLAEQEAIAAALSDADAWIESLETLIEKQRAVKLGAMQALLTPPGQPGHQRLPGFTGAWEVKRLGALFSFSGGVSACRAQLSHTGHCYLHYGDIHTRSSTQINVDSEFAIIPKLDISLGQIPPTALLNDGDVVFVDASEDEEGASKHVVVVNPRGVPFIAGLHTIVAKATNEDIEHAYLRFCFHTRSIRDQFRFYTVGTKVTGISKGNITKIELCFPKSTEQSAIAAVLSDLDAEVEALEAKLAKARQIKQGMMQELLTGRVRLV